jgi:beta-galactosidase
MNRFPWWVFIGVLLGCGTSLHAVTDGGAPAGQGLDATGGPPGDGDAGPVAEGGSRGETDDAGGGGPGTDGAPPDGAITDDGSVPTPVPTPATDRSRTQLQNGWKFTGSNTLTGAQAPTYDDSGWATVSVPHTWDSVTASSNRLATFTNAWYRTHFTVATADARKRFYVQFEGAFQVADVYVNGQHLGQHRGGYTRFVFDATPAVAAGDNVLAVQVSNADCADCLPDTNTRLFKGYGGIYRKAWLVTTNPYHVATTDFASSGIYVTPSAVSSASASVTMRILVTNDGTTGQTFTVRGVVSDASGHAVVTAQNDVAVAASTTVPVTLSGTVANPTLWGPGTPYLYDVLASITVGGALTDAVGERIGFRSYQLTATDFTLNGASNRLRGVAKHQETEYHASAVSDAELVADWDNLRDLGVNYVRLVHYPHAQLEYDLADQRGIMVWAEDGQTNGGAPTPNGDNIAREMVYQNWNHPSIIFWSAGNEATGVAATSEYASVIKAADPSRPVVYASNGQTPTGVDLIFHNTYAGWYGGTMYDWLTAPDHWVSETGAGAAIATHTADAFGMTFTVNSYEPEDYGALVNEVRFDDLFRTPSHVPAFSGWVFRDISDVKYKNLLNTKGLLTYAGYKKDIFYHYQSLLQKTPVVHLVGRQYFLRGANGAGQGAVKAYSNAQSLTLTVNGTATAPLANGQYTHPNGTPIRNVFYWPNVLNPGKNVVSASDGAAHVDTMTVYFRGAGTTLPADAGGAVQNLTSSNGPAYFIDTPISDQLPFYVDFDGTGDNTFDLVPAAAAGASFIGTRRQSDATKQTNLAFDLPSGATVFILFTKQAAVPAWITSAGFTDTGATGQWRDNTPKLVDYSLYSHTFGAGSHVALTTSAIDYLILIK